MSRAGTPVHDARPYVLWHEPADASAAGEIEGLLAGRGYQRNPGLDAPADAPLICILSPASGADGLREVAAASHGRRLVVLCIAPVDAATIPPEIAEPHWLLWENFSPAERASLLVTALSTTIDEHRSERTLLSDARIWAESGHLPDLLAEPGPARRMAHEVEERTREGFSFPPEALDFVSASAHKARALRRRSLRRWATRIGAVAAILLLAFTGLRSLENRKRVDTLGRAVAILPTDTDRPNLSAARLIGAQLEIRRYDGPRYPGLERATADALTSRWPRLTLANVWTDSAPVSLDAASPEGRIITGEGRGTVTMFSSADGGVLWRVSITDSRIDRVASSSDRGTIAAVDADGDLVVLDVATSEPARSVPAGDVSGLAVSADGRRALLSGTGVDEVDLESFSRRRLDVDGTVLAVSRSAAPDREWTAVVRRGESIDLVDPVSGRVLAGTRTPADSFEKAALSPGGGRAAVATGGRLVSLTQGGESTVIGSVPEVVAAVAVTDRGEVGVTSRAAGNRAFLADGAVDDDFCGLARGGVEALAWSPEGDLVCLHAVNVLVETPDRPVAGPGPGHTVTDTMAIAPPRNLRTGGHPLVSAASPRHGDAAVGTTGGGVLLLGIDPEGATVEAGRWSSPDRRDVTALAWSGDGAELLARTTDRWWPVRICPGCSGDLDTLVAKARPRFTSCFDPAMRNLLHPDTVDTLGLRICEAGPAPERRTG
ncbi:hypothetical protein GQF49_06840 [Microbacter sp. ANSKLAB05]|nr:hypothetical protein [Microbacter sp. ANSKLAB05]